MFRVKLGLIWIPIAAGPYTDTGLWLSSSFWKYRLRFTLYLLKWKFLLKAGIYTQDISDSENYVSTSDMGDAIIKEIKQNVWI